METDWKKAIATYIYQLFFTNKKEEEKRRKRKTKEECLLFLSSLKLFSLSLSNLISYHLSISQNMKNKNERKKKKYNFHLLRLTSPCRRLTLPFHHLLLLLTPPITVTQQHQPNTSGEPPFTFNPIPSSTLKLVAHTLPISTPPLPLFPSRFATTQPLENILHNSLNYSLPLFHTTISQSLLPSRNFRLHHQPSTIAHPHLSVAPPSHDGRPSLKQLNRCR